MADFHQHTRLSTIHDFGTASVDHLEGLLVEAAASSGIGLILPVTAADMRADPFGQIIAELEEVSYLSNIAVVLGVAPEQRYLQLDQSLVRRPRNPRDASRRRPHTVSGSGPNDSYWQNVVVVD